MTLQSKSSQLCLVSLLWWMCWNSPGSLGLWESDCECELQSSSPCVGSTALRDKMSHSLFLGNTCAETCCGPFCMATYRTNISERLLTWKVNRQRNVELKRQLSLYRSCVEVSDPARTSTPSVKRQHGTVCVTALVSWRQQALLLFCTFAAKQGILPASLPSYIMQMWRWTHKHKPSDASFSSYRNHMSSVAPDTVAIATELVKPGNKVVFISEK